MINIPVNRPVFRPIHQLITEYYGTGYVPSIMLDFTTGNLDTRINFSRTTNATVTNSAGLITYAPHNLLTFSEQFDNAAWTKTTTTVTANAIASPTSTTTGDTLTAGGANSTTLNSYTAIAQAYTFSIYIRRRTGTGAIEITADGSTYVAKTITSDWTRFDTTITPTAGTRTPGVRIVTSGDAIDVWGAQLEIGSTATTYNPTTVKNLLGYSELFDNAAWTKSNSFVQTNLLTYSEAFDNAAYTKDGVTISANTVTAPNGYQTADTVTGTTGNFRFWQLATILNGSAYTMSVYAKQGTSPTIGFGFINVALSTPVFTFATETWATPANWTTSYQKLDNGWYRLIATYTSNATLGGPSIIVSGATTAYIWGLQLVQGSVAGDYRRTDAAALPVYYPNHNGVVCAEKLVLNNVNSTHTIYNSGTQSSGATTFSIYAKAGEKTWIALEGKASTYSFFNLASGEKGTSGNLISNSITPVGNGWYRCSITFNGTGATTNVTIWICNGDTVTTYTGDGTSGIYIFGAQLSDSASLDPYVLNATAAPTAAAYYGARFDYDPVTLQPKGLLIEEQRTNLVIQSTNFTAPQWSVTNAGVSTDSTTAPDNTLTADTLTQDTATGEHKNIYSIVFGSSAAGSYSLSMYVKPNGTRYIKAALTDNATGSFGTTNIYDLQAGTVTSGTGTITNVGNGWFRITASGTKVNTAVNCGIQVFLRNATNTADSFTGDGVSGIYIWGAQLEAGAFSTSYIPTAASQVTRAADVATIQGSNFYSWYNQNEGSIYLSANVVTAQPTNLFEISGTSGSDYIAVDYNSGATSQFRTLIRTNNTFEMNQNNGSTKTTGVYKYALGYKTNDCAFTISGDSVLTDSAVNLPILNKFAIVARPTGVSSYGTTTIQSLSYCNTRLSNATLQGLIA